MEDKLLDTAFQQYVLREVAPEPDKYEFIILMDWKRSHGVMMFCKEDAVPAIPKDLICDYQSLLQYARTHMNPLEYEFFEKFARPERMQLEILSSVCNGLCFDYLYRQNGLAYHKRIMVHKMDERYYVIMRKDTTDFLKQENRISLQIAPMEYEKESMLLNRHAFDYRVSEYLKSNLVQDRLSFLFRISLEGTNYHEEAEQILKQSAECLKQVFHNRGIIGRMDKEQFAAFVNSSGCEKEAERFAGEVAHFFSRKAENPCTIRCCIGIALAPVHSRSYSRLQSCAESALRAAREKEGDSWMIYNSDLCE